MSKHTGRTLEEEIGRIFKAKRVNVETLTSFFANYYGGKTEEEDQDRPDILKWSIEDIIKNSGIFSMNIVEGLKSFPNDKYNLACRLEELFKKLEDTHGLSMNKEMLESFKYKSKNERLLSILKYLHSGERTRAQIANDFGISERALAADMKELLDGFNFLGVEMKINQLERKKNTYRSMIHPVFLAMHSAEIYAMTIGLKLLSKDTVFEESLGRIADVVFKQLSGYAQEMVNGHEDETQVLFRDDSTKFLNSYELLLKEKPFTYYLKEPLLCKVTYIEKGKIMESVGTIHLAKSGFNRIIVAARNYPENKNPRKP